MSTALAPIDVNTYALIADGDIEELTEAISENLNGGALSLKNLTRITTPTGGSTVFQVPTPEGMKNAETLEGIILVQQPRRVFYSRPMGAGGDENNRPDCFSNDSLVGVGTRATSRASTTARPARSRSGVPTARSHAAPSAASCSCCARATCCRSSWICHRPA
jgi:hypothetical protein